MHYYAFHLARQVWRGGLLDALLCRSRVRSIICDLNSDLSLARGAQNWRHWKGYIHRYRQIQNQIPTPKKRVTWMTPLIGLAFCFLFHRSRLKLDDVPLVLLLLPDLWNRLPIDMRCSCSLNSFKRQLKTLLFTMCALEVALLFVWEKLMTELFLSISDPVCNRIKSKWSSLTHPMTKEAAFP